MPFIHLTQFGFLSVDGKDAITFLQGYTTCDLERLKTGDLAFGAICNLQGRMVTNFRGYRTADGILLRFNRELIATVQSFLSKYIVFSKAVMSDMSDNYTCYGILDTSTPAPEEAIVISIGNRRELWSAASLNEEAPDANEWASSEWIGAEIEDGFAWVDGGSSGEYLPQMFNLDRLDGIDFTKGCYLGQEIIARLQYRGALKRRLYRGVSSGPLVTGETLHTPEGTAFGKIVSVARRANDTVMLAVLNANNQDEIRVISEAGDTLTCQPVSGASDPAPEVASDQ